MRRRLIPYSFAFFVVLAGTILLQFVPLVNILMLVTASVWPTLLGNAGLIGIALEATFGRLARAWLIVPAIAYGSYCAIAIPQHYAAARLQDERAAEAARMRVLFNPAHTALVVGGRVRSDLLVREYGLPVVFETASDGPERSRSTRYLGKDICAAAAARLPQDTPWVQLQWLDADGDALGAPQGAAGCILQMPESSPDRKLRAIAMLGPNEAEGFDSSSLDVEMTAPDGTRTSLRGGIARPLLWLPAPFIWCGPSLSDEAAGGSGCKAGLLREGDLRGWHFQKAETEQTSVLAHALGLSPARPAWQANPRTGALVLARLDAYLARQVAEDLVLLDKMIAAPGAPLKLGEARLLWLKAFPDHLSSRAEGLMRLLEHEVRTGHPTAQAYHLGSELVSALPDSDVVRFGPRILALYTAPAVANARGHWLWNFDRLVERLGDLGPSAIPVLTIRNMRGGQIRALCRIGVPARESAAPLFARFWSKDFGGLELFELAVATQRIGLPMGSVSVFRQQKDRHFLEEAAKVTPDSSASVCDIAANREAAQAHAELAARQAEFYQRHHPGE